MTGNVHGGWSGAVRKGAGVLVVGPVMAGVLAAPAFADGGSEKPSPTPDGADSGRSARVELFLEAGAESSRPGEEFDMRTTVTNVEAEAMESALLAQHVPEGLEIVGAGNEGVVREGIVNWRVDVPAGGEEAYTVRVRVPEDGGRERVTSTACLLLQREAEPVVCASDAVEPGGATVMSRLSEYMGPAALLRAAGVLLAVGLAWMLLRRGGVLRRGWGGARR